MAENSKIEWTHHTFNPWIGCSKVHEGCAHCYAMEMMDTRYGKVKWGPNGTRVITGDENWKKPLKWNREAQKAGERRRVFCASLADVFEDWPGPILTREGQEVGTMNDVRRRLFDLIDATPFLDWLLLTKRPQNIRKMWNALDDRPAGNLQKFRANVWLGTSISHQESADKQIPELLKCRGLSPILFLSVEPLLGPVDLSTWMHGELDCEECCLVKPGEVCLNCRGTGVIGPNTCIDWVIVGGESGHGARPMHPEWVRSIRDQCGDARVPFLFKQHGEWLASELSTDDQAEMKGEIVYVDTSGNVHSGIDDRGVDFFGGDKQVARLGKKAAGRLLDGREWNEFPTIAESHLKERS